MRLGRAAIAGGAMVLVSAAAIGWLNRAQSPSAESGDASAEPEGSVEGGWQVSRVVDGDTIRVQRDGQEIVVRLIGIDSPESVKPDAPVECFGPQASEFARQRLDGQVVALERDPSQQPTDRYGRTLAYAWLVDAGGQVQSLFNLDAIEAGVAREATYDGRYAWQQAFRAAEKQAREQGIGLWGACDGG